MRNHPCVYMIGRDYRGMQRCSLKADSVLPCCVYTGIGKGHVCKYLCQTPKHLNKRFWRKFKDIPMGQLKGWVICTFVEAGQGYQQKIGL
jgi:hypothetical protein